jgi:xylulokinase
VRKVLYTASRDTEPLEAIGVTSFGEAFAMLDENDRPLSNSILYTDTRAEEMCSLLIGKTGREKIMDIAGVNPTSNFSISNIMWLKHYRPERYKKAKKVLLYASYVVYMLTGEEVIDYSLACRTMAFDRNRLEWSREILDAAEIDPALIQILDPVDSQLQAVIVFEYFKGYFAYMALYSVSFILRFRIPHFSVDRTAVVLQDQVEVRSTF